MQNEDLLELHQRLFMAVYFNAPPGIPARAVQRFMMPYYITEQWYREALLYNLFGDRYTRAQRKLEQRLCDILEINKASWKNGGRVKYFTVMAYTLFVILLYKIGLIKVTHQTFLKLANTAIAAPIAVMDTISIKQPEFLKSRNLFFLNDIVNRMWQQVAWELFLS